MTGQEHSTIINQIMEMVSSEHQASASELLTTLSEDYTQTLSEVETSNQNVTRLTEDNEKLRRVNADLFLKVSNGKKQETETETGKETDDIPSFDSLFNEKGELL
jgi:uncharacterized membrane-anchored protein YhcB (DUF1043 family)